MDRLTSDEARIYEEIEPHKAYDALKVLIPADEIVSDMDTPLGRLVMNFLYNYRKSAGTILFDAIHSNEAVTETQRIEYKQINLLIKKIENIGEQRERTIDRVRREIKEFFTLDKDDNM